MLQISHPFQSTGNWVHSETDNFLVTTILRKLKKAGNDTSNLSVEIRRIPADDLISARR